MTDDEDGCTLALPPRRAEILEVLLEYGVATSEAIETAVEVPARYLRRFYGYRHPRADRPGAGRRRSVFTAGRR